MRKASRFLPEPRLDTTFRLLMTVAYSRICRGTRDLMFHCVNLLQRHKNTNEGHTHLSDPSRFITSDGSTRSTTGDVSLYRFIRAFASGCTRCGPQSLCPQHICSRIPTETQRLPKAKAQIFDSLFDKSSQNTSYAANICRRALK